MTDTLGCLFAVKVHRANLHDTKAGIFPAIQAYRKYSTIKKFCGDGGYRGTFVEYVKSILELDTDISQKIVPDGWKVIPKRWIVVGLSNALLLGSIILAVSARIMKSRLPPKKPLSKFLIFTLS